MAAPLREPAPLRVLSHLGALPAIVEALPDAEVVGIPTEGPLDDGVEGTVLLTIMRGTPNLAEVLDRGVEWIHTIGTGVDEFPLHLVGGRPLTCSRGVNAVNIAEWTMAQLLCAEKQLPAMWVDTPPSPWGMADLGGLAGRTLALVGLGTIGTAVARRALAFDVHVRALRRSATPSSVDGVTVVGSVAELLDGADHVVLAVPSTPATRGLVDAGFLAAMPPGGHLVNVARGDLVDEDALHAALDSGHLALASLDVARVEPLPDGHWLYTHPNVRFSPHVSWSGPGLWEAMQQAFVDNVRRWTDGRPLVGIVDVAEGY